MRSNLPLFVASAALGLCPLAAQSLPGFSYSLGADFHFVDGSCLALGPGYKAFLEPQGVQFVPALGERAPHNLPLNLGFAHAERGGQLLVAAAPTAPRRAGEFALYERAAGVTERYDATDAGLELSYVFEQRPQGDGDLVVRVRVATELPLVDAGSERLVFERADLGGVSIGAVTGIDAAGARVAGRLASGIDEQGRYVEFSLPDAFVDQAEFPLVLDPLIGTSFVIGGALANQQLDPDQVWSESSDLWVATWGVVYSATDHDIVVQTFSPAGAPQSGMIPFESGVNTLAQRPQIAAVDPTDRVAVAWTQTVGAGGTAYVRSMRTNGTGLSNLVVIQSSGGTVIDEVDLGGQRSGSGSALAVWSIGTPSSGYSVRSRSIQVPQSGDPTVGVIFIVSATAKMPRLARFPAATGNYLLGVSDNSDISCLLLNSQGVPTGASITQLLPSILSFPFELDVDASADGQRYYASFVAVNLFGSTSARHDWFGKPDTGAPGGIATIVTQSTGVGPSSDVDPLGVAVSGSSAFVFGRGLQALELTRFALSDGERISTITLPLPGGPFAYTPSAALAAQSTAFSATSDGLFLSCTSGSDVYGQLADVFGGGNSVSLGGACGGGGTVTVSGPIAIGNETFNVGNSGVAAGSQLAILNMAAAPFPVSCGFCAWNPFFITNVRIPSGTSLPPVTLPIPLDSSLISVQIELQWTVVGTPQSPCALFANASVSDRLRLTIGE
jgi:hypothetical protein